MAWQKRISAPKWWPIEKKKSTYVVVPRGSHKDKIALQVVVRDALKLASNGDEAKKTIKSGKIMVDGRARKDIKYGVGAMDVITVPELNKSWRAVPRNGLTFIETTDSNKKICKISDIKILKGGKMQINLSNGRNILSDKKYATNGSLVIEVPSQKIIDSFEMKNGNIIIVTGGKYEGTISKIDEMDTKNKRLWIEVEGQKTEVPMRFATVIGKDKSAIDIE